MIGCVHCGFLHSLSSSASGLLLFSASPWLWVERGRGEGKGAGLGEGLKSNEYGQEENEEEGEEDEESFLQQKHKTLTSISS